MQLVPNRFLFRVRYVCPFVADIPDDDENLFRLPESCRVDSLADMDGKSDFADVRLGWNESGLAIEVDVRGKDKDLECDASKIRVHGDYHLGQILWSQADFYLLDFEGEPARPIEERRGKQSPLKDVAGMMRSFGYAAYAALFAHAASRPAEFERLEPWARIWQTWVTAAFLRGYFTASAGAPFVPAESSSRDALLQAFVLDKAIYELNYELNNRPEWVRIPIRGIMEILTQS